MDGFDEDEPESESDKGTVVLGGLLAAERHTLEAFGLTNELLDTGTSPRERLGKNGRIEVDTNTVERTMRPIALGRKNALFAGSESGARTWAILASLINTAKLNDLDPQTYLADVLEQIISRRTPVNRLAELLAWTWKAARATMASTAA